MALIGKIREKSGLLLVVVGIAMLAFILGGWDSMFGGYTDELGIGVVYGEKIDETKYRIAVENTMMQDQQQAQQQQREYTQKIKTTRQIEHGTCLLKESFYKKNLMH
jgi:peptidyl-prolyl cis-trans isomerase D